MKTIKDYFRTTYHDGIQLESDLKTHELDSFDCIKIARKLEDDMGYIIHGNSDVPVTKDQFLKKMAEVTALVKQHKIDLAEV